MADMVKGSWFTTSPWKPIGGFTPVAHQGCYVFGSIPEFYCHELSPKKQPRKGGDDKMIRRTHGKIIENHGQLATCQNVSRCTDFVLISTLYNINLSDPCWNLCRFHPSPWRTIQVSIPWSPEMLASSTKRRSKSLARLAWWQRVAPHPATSPELGLHATISCKRLDLTQIEIWQTWNCAWRQDRNQTLSHTKSLESM